MNFHGRLLILFRVSVITGLIMTKEFSNKELARLIKQGFDHTATREQVEGIDNRLGVLEQRFDVLERKVDRVLYQEIDRHERWIKQLADKIGVELSR